MSSRLQPSKAVPVTVMIFTLNEEIHLPTCLASIERFDDIIVVDSYSTDGTHEICEHAGVTFCQHEFGGFGSQRNWALKNIGTKYAWVLILDADERVTVELADEIKQKIEKENGDISAYRLKRKFYFWGRWLKYSSLYPTWVVRLIHKDRVRYKNRGHGETQEVDGKIGELKSDLIDENLKGIDEWFDRQNKYSTKDAQYELHLESQPLNYRALLSSNPLERRNLLKLAAARMPFRGLIYFIYSYIWRRGFLDGKDGFMFCLMRSLYQSTVSVKKYDMLRRKEVAHSQLPGKIIMGGFETKKREEL